MLAPEAVSVTELPLHIVGLAGDTNIVGLGATEIVIALVEEHAPFILNKV